MTNTNHSTTNANTPATSESTALRLEELERAVGRLDAVTIESRRWRTLAFAGGFAAIVLGGVAATQSARTPDVIRARRFEVVDQNDKIVLLAGIGQNGGQLDLWGNGGTNVVRIGSNADGGDIAVWNAAQQSVAAMYASAQGGRVEATMADASGSAILRAEGAGPAMVISDRDDRPRVVATATTASSGLSIRNAQGSELVALGASEGNGGIVRLAQGDGTIGAQMLALTDGGVIECAGKAGGRAAVLGVAGPDSGGTLSLYGTDGAEMIAAQAHTDAGARIALFGSNKLPSIVAETGSDNAGLIGLNFNGTRVAGLGASSNGGLMNLSKADGKAVVVAGVASDADGGAISVRSGSGSQLVRLGIDRIGAGEVAVFDGPGLRKRVLNATATQP